MECEQGTGGWVGGLQRTWLQSEVKGNKEER